METLSFTLGVLSVISVAFVIVLVWGIVKVIKQQKQIKDLQLYNEETRQILYKTQDEMYRSMRDYNNDFNRVIDYDRKEINQRIDNCHSYIDSRIDKLIDTYFDIKNLNKNNKELIKG
jgi:hypothetical protein